MTNEEAIEFIKIDISRLWNTPQNLEHKEALEMAIKALEQEPFINKPCISDKVCEHDKQMVLDKIRAEIELKEKTLTDKYGQQKYGIWTDNVLEIIDKYKTKSEDKE